MSAIGSHNHSHEHHHDHSSNTAVCPRSGNHNAAHAETDGTGTTMNSMPGWFYDVMLFVFTMGRERRQRREIVALAQIQTGERVLDVGCGTGHLARLVAEETLAGSVRGIDPNQSMIARAQQQAVKLNQLPHPADHLLFDVGTAQALPVLDAAVDVVLCTFAYHHFPSAEIQRQALVEMWRVLVPGGRLLLVDFPGGEHPHGGGHHHDHSHSHSHSHEPTLDGAQRHPHRCHNPFAHCQSACCETKQSKHRDDEDVANDPLLDRIREAGFEQVTGHPVTMLSGVAVLAMKPPGNARV